jgi:hypothetical protein
MFRYEEYGEHITEETVNNNQKNDNHLLKSGDFISKPIKSIRCTINENILKLQYPLLD